MPGSGRPLEDAAIGKTIGPDVMPEGDPSAVLEAFMDAAEEWGWIRSSTRSRAMQHVRRGLSLSSLGELKRELESGAATESTEETRAFLNHFEKTSDFGN